MNIENRIEREYNRQTGKTRYDELEQPCEDYTKWLEEKVNENVILGSVVKCDTSAITQHHERLVECVKSLLDSLDKGKVSERAIMGLRMLTNK